MHLRMHFYSLLLRQYFLLRLSMFLHCISLCTCVTVTSIILSICNNNLQSTSPPFPQIDIIGAVVIVWRVRGKTIRSVRCNIVRNNCAQCNAHTYEQT